MNKQVFEFINYMIHVCSEAWKMSPSSAYGIMERTGCISNYLIPYYDVLHTQGSGYIADDIKRYVSLRGEKV